MDARERLRGNFAGLHIFISVRKGSFLRTGSIVCTARGPTSLPIQQKLYLKFLHHAKEIADLSQQRPCDYRNKAQSR